MSGRCIASFEALESRTMMSAGLPVVSLSAPYKGASENGPTIRAFVLTRTGKLASKLVVNLALGGSAGNGTDYGTIGTKVTFPIGKDTIRVCVRPVDDALRETRELVTLALQPGSGYTPSATLVSDWIKITDNDGYDTRMNINWTQKAASPVWRCESAKAVIDGKLYVFGGFIEGDSGPMTRSDVYDPKTDTWTQIADLPTRVTHAGSAVDGTKVYLAGGYVGTGPVLGMQDYGTTDVWVYDAVINSYSKGPSLPEPRGAGVMVKMDRELHYLGGCDPQRIDHTDHWILNLDNPGAGWTNSVPLPAPRNHVGAAIVDGHLFIIGGQVGPDDNTGAKDNLWVWHPAWNAWKILGNLPAPLSHFNEATLVQDGRIITLGGIPLGGGSVADVWSYTPQTATWTKMTSLPAKRYTGVAALIDGEIYYSTGAATTTFKGTLF